MILQLCIFRITVVATHSRPERPVFTHSLSGAAPGAQEVLGAASSGPGRSGRSRPNTGDGGGAGIYSGLSKRWPLLRELRSPQEGHRRTLPGAATQALPSQDPMSPHRGTSRARCPLLPHLRIVALSPFSCAQLVSAETLSRASGCPRPVDSVQQSAEAVEGWATPSHPLAGGGGGSWPRKPIPGGVRAMVKRQAW